CAMAPSFAALMGARVLAAAAHGTFFGLAIVLATSSVPPERRATALSIVVGGIAVANIVGVGDRDAEVGGDRRQDAGDDELGGADAVGAEQQGEERQVHGALLRRSVRRAPAPPGASEEGRQPSSATRSR
ncbi:MAG TPA: hypothetical protein VM891_04485, partial [Amaricoccus sp.]|nr:hypothetical protein [Amaricoccus sp.]